MRLLTALCIILALLIGMHEAFASGPDCMTDGQFHEKVKEHPDEMTRQAVAAINRSAIIEVYLIANTDRWVMLITNAQGVSCIVIGGHSWIEHPDK